MKVILGIETSCDETAAAIVREDKKIIAEHLWSQVTLHSPYGGVVPEIAARSHIKRLDQLISQSMKAAAIPSFDSLDAIAVTAGPGLIGGVIVGVMTAKAIASAASIPCIAINHLEGHALSVRLNEEVVFPYLLLLISGGHCMCFLVRGLGNYQLLGQSLDDALGEAFDKVAKMMNLGYPGGAKIEALAKQGNATRFHFPRSLKGRKGCDFSFSGIKTAVMRQIQSIEPLSDQDKADIAASFQECVGDILVDRVTHALKEARDIIPDISQFVIAGGVAANQQIRRLMKNLCAQYHFECLVPPVSLCTDNASMIAWAGMEYLAQGVSHSLDFTPRARWPLSNN